MPATATTVPALALARLSWCREQGGPCRRFPPGGLSPQPEFDTRFARRSRSMRPVSFSETCTCGKVAVWRMLNEICARVEDLLQIDIDDLVVHGRCCTARSTGTTSRIRCCGTMHYGKVSQTGIDGAGTGWTARTIAKSRSRIPENLASLCQGVAARYAQTPPAPSTLGRTAALSSEHDSVVFAPLLPDSRAVPGVRPAGLRHCWGWVVAEHTRIFGRSPPTLDRCWTTESLVRQSIRERSTGFHMLAGYVLLACGGRRNVVMPPEAGFVCEEYRYLCRNRSVPSCSIPTAENGAESVRRSR